MATPADSATHRGPNEVDRLSQVPPCPGCGETNWAVIYDLTLGVAVTAEGVERVVVEDENLGPVQRVVCRECGFEIHDEEARAHTAARLAETVREWPRWEFGW